MDKINDDFAATMARFASNKIVIYRQPHRRIISDRQRIQNEINFEKKEYNGYMSKATKSYITKKIDTWYQACKYYNRYHARNNQASKKILTFLTLTLPAVQAHTDNEIKRECLNHFIIACTRSGRFTHYFWRSEAQKNGNIHFHFLIDSYFDKIELQKIWCKCVERLGYVKAYQDVHGFKLPPCTQIQVIPPTQTIIDYVTKYVGKSEVSRKIEGRIWGMSDSLRNILPSTELVDNQIESRINKYIDDDRKNVYEDENCMVVKIRWELRQKYEYDFRKDVLEKFEKANCMYLYFGNDLPINVLYPVKKKDTVKLAENIKFETKWQQLGFDFGNNL